MTSDRDLLDAFETGDQAAFGEIVSRYGGLVYASCRRQLAAADADDATQAVFVVLSRKPAQARSAPALAAWLLTVANFVVKNARRGQARRRRAEQEAAVMPISNHDAARDPIVLSHLDELLASLPEHERQVLILHVMRGMSQDEVAVALGCPEGTVRSRLSRGLARLRDRFARKGAVMSIAALATALSGQAGAAVPDDLGALIAGRIAGAAGSSSYPQDRVGELADQAQRSMAAPTALTLIAAVCVVVGIALAVALPWLGGRASAAALPAIAIAPVLPAAAVSDPDHDADPAAYLPEDAQAIVRLNDLVRSRERFAHTPYGEFMLTGTGAWISRSMAEERASAEAGKKSDPAAAPKKPRFDYDQVMSQLASTRRIVVGAHLADDWDRKMNANSELPKSEQTSGLLRLLKDNVVYSMGVTSNTVDAGLDARLQEAVHADPTVGRTDAWTAGTEYGRLTRRGRLLVFSNAPLVDDLPAPKGDAKQVDAGADLECQSTGLVVQGQRTPPGWFTSTLDGNGVTSRRFSAYGPDDGGAPAWRVRPANLALLRSLPADTLVAFVRSCSRQQLPLKPNADVTRAIEREKAATIDIDPGDGTGDSSQAEASKTLAQGTDPVSVFLTDLLTRLGAVELPDHVTIDGDCLAYIRAGTPFPSVTIAVACDEPEARELVRAIAVAAGTQVDENGTCATTLYGMLPVQASYRDGVLIATTHRGGIDEHLHRVGGFDGNSEVRAALAQVPASAYATCVLRGGALLAQARPFLPLLASQLPAKDAHALDHLFDDITSTYENRYDVFYDTASEQGRSAFASGPLAGPIGMIIDAGMGGLPMARIWN